MNPFVLSARYEQSKGGFVIVNIGGFVFCIYILECFDGSYYTGHTDNLEKRLYQHNKKVFPDCYTATRLPVKHIYTQTFSNRDEAIAAEIQIKGWSRKKKEALMNSDWDEISRLSRKKCV